MSHIVDIDGIAEKLIILEHYANGSYQYCKDRLVASEEDQGYGSFDDYWGWTKGIVSNNILECAIKLRVIQDSCRDNPSLLIEWDKTACKEFFIGNVVEGNFQLSIRESCNKIIHATNVIPCWKEGDVSGIRFKYWSGEYQLSGMHNKKKWQLILNIHQWSKAFIKFLDLYGSTDEHLYLGQDWKNERGE